MSSPVCSDRRPGPTASTSPCWGFSLAVSGMTRPLAVVSSDSPGLTTMRSSRGCRFIRSSVCARSRASPLASTLDWRVLTLRARPGTFNRRVPALAFSWYRRYRSVSPVPGKRSDQAQVGVGAGVEGGGAVVAEAPVPGGGDHGGVVGTHGPTREEPVEAVLDAGIEEPLPQLGVGGHTAAEAQGAG